MTHAAHSTSTQAVLVTDCSTHSLIANKVSGDFLKSIPRDFARQHLIISQGLCDSGPSSTIERLAVAESTDPAAIFNIGVHLGVQVDSFVADGELIARVIDEAYGNVADSRVQGEVNVAEDGSESMTGIDIDRMLAAVDRDLLSTDGKGPIIKLIDGLLFEALGKSASDVHVQPLADRTLVRYRLDGVLHTVRELPEACTSPIISRIKVMGKMDIAERRIPQDGRASVTIGSRSIDLRISTLPTSYGERCVIRLLDNSHHLDEVDLVAGLGMPPDLGGLYLDRAGRAHGMVLLTGPTGSGKTTTLYATLRQIGSDALNIMTIEDPIEYELSSAGIRGKRMENGAGGGGAISQSQVNAKKGITFATGLRHILRQDPDVVMVGEIRDGETARIAIQSSLTGHLVFSTLHTNDAASAVTRLIDLGVEPYLVSASLSAVLAQRLVRVFHRNCDGKGCDACLHTGFRGRTGLFELLVVDDKIGELISSNAPLATIRQTAMAGGMTTLRSEGERLVREGLTSMVEVHRVVQGAL